jgi:hypothetical protein
MLRTRILLAASLGLMVSWNSAQATHPWSKPQPCPPVIVPYTPTEQRPSDLPPAEATPAAPLDLAAPTAPAFAATDLGEGSAVMLGRGDQNQRFNLFDHMAAIPQTRAWFGFQYMNDYTTGLSLSSSFIDFMFSNGFSDQEAILDELAAHGISSDVFTDRKVFLYRAGVEVALCPNFSLAAQWEYFTVNGETVEDGFNNPQIMAKYVLCRSDSCVVSAILGFEPETETDPFEFKEERSRLYPGALFYKDCGDFILQGGFQFGIPLSENQVHTFDWALSLGYWLYRNPRCCDLGCAYSRYGNGCGGCSGCGGGDWCGGCGWLKGSILGVIPQVELYGKHVLGDATVTSPFNTPTFFDIDDSLPGDEYSGTIFLFEEPRNVIDLTIGANILVTRSCSIATGVSFPLTGDDVRNFEYLLYLNYSY